MDKYLRSSKINLTISKEQCGKDLVGMVVRSGLSLFSFSGPPFKSTLGAIASTLRVSLHRDNIRQLIINEATKKVNELKKILEEKSVFIKLDSCTRLNPSYLGVNVQFEMDSSIQVQVLCVDFAKYRFEEWIGSG